MKYSSRGDAEYLNRLEKLKNFYNSKKSIIKQLFFDEDVEFWPDTIDKHKFAIEKCWNNTRTSMERMQTLCRVIDHVLKNDIKGDFVECGGWKGGNIGLFKLLGSDPSRNIWGFDTFEGMSKPCSKDGNHAISRFNKLKINSESSLWCDASLDEVKDFIESLDYSGQNSKIKFIKGKVENTLLNKKNIPEVISILRLDTDFYESTLTELSILYPRLISGGFLIMDDYGHWEGAKRAFDEYFKDDNLPFISACDYTCRYFIKP